MKKINIYLLLLGLFCGLSVSQTFCEENEVETLEADKRDFEKFEKNIRDINTYLKNTPGATSTNNYKGFANCIQQGAVGPCSNAILSATTGSFLEGRTIEACQDSYVQLQSCVDQFLNSVGVKE